MPSISIDVLQEILEHVHYGNPFVRVNSQHVRLLKINEGHYAIFSFKNVIEMLYQLPNHNKVWTHVYA